VVCCPRSRCPEATGHAAGLGLADGGVAAAAKATESDVMKLHGMGANAMQVHRNALVERGLSFRDG
jgi:hypothetical protein